MFDQVRLLALLGGAVASGGMEMISATTSSLLAVRNIDRPGAGHARRRPRSAADADRRSSGVDARGSARRQAVRTGTMGAATAVALAMVATDLTGTLHPEIDPWWSSATRHAAL
jgi:hypothetical protein